MHPASTIEEHYDVIVLGTDLPGLLAAGLMARQGMRIAVLGQGEHPPTYRVGPYTLPTSLSLAASPQSPAGQHVERALNLSSLFSPKASLGACSPSKRIHLRPGPQNASDEMLREFSDEHQAWMSWMSRSEKLGAEQMASLTAERTGAQNRIVKQIRALLRPNAETSKGRPWATPTPSEEALWRLADSVYRFATVDHPTDRRTEDAWDARGTCLSHLLSGGLSSPGTIRSELLHRIERAGGTVRLQWSCASVEKVGRDFEIPIRQQDRIIRSTEVVAGLSLQTLRGLTESTEKNLVEAKEQKARMRFVTHAVVRKACVPDVVAKQLIAYEHPSRPDLHIVIADANDDDFLLSTESLLPIARADAPATIERARDAALDHLFELFPGLSEGLVLVDSPHDGRSPQGYAEESTTSTLDLWSRGPQFAASLLRRSQEPPLSPRPSRIGPGIWLAQTASAGAQGFDGAAALALALTQQCSQHQPRRFRRRLL